MATIECPLVDVHSYASRAEAHKVTARQCQLPIDKPTAVEVTSTVVASLAHRPPSSFEGVTEGTEGPHNT